MSIVPYQDKFPKIEDSVYIAPGVWVIGDVEIGERSSIWFNTVVRGDEHYIRIGSETNIQDNCTLHVTGGRFPLEIGNRITVGHRAIVHGCVVEDGCLIGMGAVVMDGARIGRGSFVAAGAVVTPGFVVPPDSLIMGVPGVVKGKVGDSERRLINESVSHYLELAAIYSNPLERNANKRVKGFLG